VQPISRLHTLALLTALTGLLLGLPAWACLNHYGKKNVHGDAIPTEERKESYGYYISRLRNHHDHEEIVKGPPPTAPPAGADFRVRNDYAVALVRRGESPKAVEILESIEKEHPGEYTVAANLGTAYELSGDLEKAHQWIGEGIRRDPKSHDGSEWLHLLILDARMAAAKDPEWAKSHGVLPLDFGGDPVPRKPTVWPAGSRDAEDVIRALTYQLGERLAFVPPPDALVGGMIADLADLLALYRSVDHAIPVYELALQYQPAHFGLVRSRLESSMKIRREEARQRQTSQEIGLLLRMAVAGAIALGLSVFVIAARRWVLKAAANP
jgi:tetratricopeptide (TPR) repeat protein